MDECPLTDDAPPPARDRQRAATAQRKFCSRCGATWSPGAAVCAHCGPREPGGPPPSKPPAPPGWSGVKRVLALYFALLAISVAGPVAANAGYSRLALEFLLPLAQAVVVAGWCVVFVRRVSSLLRWPAVRWLAIAAILSPLTFAVAVACVESLHRFFHLPAVRYAPPFLAGGYGWATVTAMVAVPRAGTVAPVNDSEV